MMEQRGEPGDSQRTAGTCECLGKMGLCSQVGPDFQVRNTWALGRVLAQRSEVYLEVVS